MFPAPVEPIPAPQSSRLMAPGPSMLHARLLLLRHTAQQVSPRPFCTSLTRVSREHRSTPSHVVNWPAQGLREEAEAWRVTEPPRPGSVPPCYPVLVLPYCASHIPMRADSPPCLIPFAARSPPAPGQETGSITPCGRDLQAPGAGWPWGPCMSPIYPTLPCRIMTSWRKSGSSCRP